MLENVEFLENCSMLGELKLSKNNIKNIKIQLNNQDIKKIDISFNQIELINFDLDKKLGQYLESISIDPSAIKWFTNFRNDRIIKKTDLYLIYKTLYLILKSKLNYVDCKLQIDLSKKNILLNLFYPKQIDNFFTICKNFDL
jgi:hypothetical protein